VEQLEVESSFSCGASAGLKEERCFLNERFFYAGKKWQSRKSGSPSVQNEM